MADMDQTPETRKHVQRAFWASSVFYILIAFEFFYMASPFAAYFYAVYGPGLDVLQSTGLTNWTVQFFLPHALEATTSPIIPVLEPLGIVLFFAGLIGFAVGAFQVYRAKLLKRDAVVSGLYRYIRHPQYLALIVASVGMLLIWPRFLVLLLTVLVVFLYIALARTEEQICLAKFEGYDDYLAKTGMFLPRLVASKTRSGHAFQMPGGLVGWVLSFVAALTLAFGLAMGLRAHAIASLVHLERPEGVYLSAVNIDDADLDEIVKIATSDPKVQNALANVSGPILGYVLPQEVYVSEIPMFLPQGQQFGHSVPSDYDASAFKVILTQAVLSPGAAPKGLDIVREAFNKSPMLEVHVDRDSETATVLPAPAVPYYADHQVPLF
jgi:protein-S-isoprenylcysteine O-methyltransferase Ste14